MANIAIIVPAAGGSALTGLAAATGGGGDLYFNSGKEMLVVTNGSGSPINVTFASQAKCNQGQSHNIVQAVAAGATEVFPPVRPDIYNDDNGQVHVTYSAVTSVTVGVLSHG